MLVSCSSHAFYLLLFVGQSLPNSVECRRGGPFVVYFFPFVYSAFRRGFILNILACEFHCPHETARKYRKTSNKRPGFGLQNAWRLLETGVYSGPDVYNNTVLKPPASNTCYNTGYTVC